MSRSSHLSTDQSKTTSSGPRISNPLQSWSMPSASTSMAPGCPTHRHHHNHRLWLPARWQRSNPSAGSPLSPSRRPRCRPGQRPCTRCSAVLRHPHRRPRMTCREQACSRQCDLLEPTDRSHAGALVQARSGSPAISGLSWRMERVAEDARTRGFVSLASPWLAFVARKHTPFSAGVVHSGDCLSGIGGAKAFPERYNAGSPTPRMMTNRKVTRPLREPDPTGDERPSAAPAVQVQPTDMSSDAIDGAELLRILEGDPHLLTDPEVAAKTPRVKRMPEGIEVLERQVGLAAGQWVLRVRCQCGRSGSRWRKSTGPPARVAACWFG